MQGAGEFPRTPCIVEAETGRTLTYADCAAAVRALRLLIGLEPRAMVMALPSGATGALLWLCALTGGHTLAPLPPDAGLSERRHAVQLVRPQVLILERAEDAAEFTCPSARVLTRQECEHAVASALEHLHEFASVRAHDRRARVTDGPLPGRAGRVCLMTSGSTGEPKGVFLTEAQIAWTADHLRRSHRLTAADRGLTVLPFFHVNAPVVSLCTMLLAGGTVVIARRFSRTRFWEWIEGYQITWASLVPTILAMLLDTEKPEFLPGTLRFVRTASAPLPVVHLLAFERRFGIPVVETYGLSEAAATVATTPVPPARRKPGSVGLPVGVELRVCRPRSGDAPEPLDDVAGGTPGEICVRGPSVIAGYAGGASAAVFQDGWFRTGDLGYRDADGYLFITGRLRDVIIRGGENIAPREIEEVLLADPLVRDAAVVGRPDPLYGQQVVAYVVPNGRWSAEREQEVRARCGAALSSFKIPEAFITVARLPRTRSGKIQRHRLAAISGLSRLSLLAELSGRLSSSRWRETVAAGISSAVTTTMARIQQVQRAQQSRALGQPVARPVKLAVESSPHHVIFRVATAPRPTVVLPVVLPVATSVAAMRAPLNMDAQTRPVAAVASTAAAEQTQGAATERRPRRPYLHELDPIRVITALAVVGVHVLTFAAVLDTTPAAMQMQLGMGSALHFTREVFMFTTAFVLVYTYAGANFDLKTFIRKRGIGVVVPYALWSLFYLVLNRSFTSPAQFTLSAVKALLSGDASYQLYYILLTIQFYALFPLLLLVLPWIRRHQWLVLGASCALELVLLTVDYVYVQTPPYASTWWGALFNDYQDRFLPIYQFYFILGAVAALNLERIRSLLRRHGATIVVTALVALSLLWMNYALAVWWLHQPDDYASSVLQPELLPYSLTVLAVLGWLACRWVARRGPNRAPRGARFWRMLADAAFGIYLVHPLVLSFALRTIAPALPTAIPVALRVGLLWAFVGSLSAAISVLLMKTPVLSRLVGRSSSLPALDRAWISTRQLLSAGRRSLSPVPVAHRGAMAAGMGEAALPMPQLASHAGEPVARAGVAPGPRSAKHALPADVSDARYSVAVATMAGTSLARATRPLAAIDVAANRGLAADPRSGHTGRERADVVNDVDEHPAHLRGLAGREYRRRRALELRQMGWKLREIAAELGVSASTVSGWLRREREEEIMAPDGASAARADVVGEPVGDLVGGLVQLHRTRVTNGPR
jgi:acyl-CoA synthetase (AMP-forming)/AMP-acid ligase II/membrane-bound acyltransferase YfiQ involved in biofilm formation